MYIFFTAASTGLNKNHKKDKISIISEKYRDYYDTGFTGINIKT